MFITFTVFLCFLTVCFLYYPDTHGHFDHVDFNGELQKFCNNCPVTLHADDLNLYQNRNLQPFRYFLPKTSSPVDIHSSGSTYHHGTISVKVIHTPGHTSGLLHL